ncbi:ABC transporter ATP-binding protein [Gammaproteobacteria bacterium]|nr:ABC transporter ATP-binding protein [Gammaproteobacteria bacterium]
MPTIEVNHVSKEYRLGTITSLKDSARNMLRRLRKQPVRKRIPFKALDDMNFTINEGEVVGIIGNNGAGKSTLLKLLAHVTIPTTGSIAVHGKVAPLIEVGAGLVPDLTGRENVYLNAAILGISRADIARKFDDIVSFSELEDFIDTPIKRYSSGMKIRLAFSIATSVDAEILIIDEVLAVGDLAFQRKCFDRMEELIKGRGSTVLIVSHNIRQIERMCSRVLLLDQGKVAADGLPLEIADLFYRRSNEKIDDDHKKSLQGKVHKYTSGEIELLSVELLNEQDQLTDSLPSGGTLRVRVKFNVNQPLKRPEIVVGTHTTDFFYLSASSTALIEDRPDLEVGTHEVEYIVPSFPLVAGTYCVRFAIFDQHRRKVFTGETLKIFTVLPTSLELRDAPMRRLHLPTRWQLDGVHYNSPVSVSTESAGA